MNRVAIVATTLLAALTPRVTLAQQTPGPQPFSVGNRVGLPVMPGADGVFGPVSPNVKVYGAIYSAESCSYDAERGVIVVPNRGVPQNVQTNNAWVSFINHDGSVHTARWIGVQSPAERASLTPPLVLNEPYGSDVANGMLYVADRDGGTTTTEPSVAVVRRFDMKTGAPAGDVRVDRVGWFNDIEAADDGTVYATVTGDRSATPDAATWQVWRLSPDGSASIFVQGAPLRQPNGIAFDPQGNIVVVNVGDDAVLTFSRAGQLVKTEHAAQAGNDGLVIMPDGTKYVSSVLNGGVSRIRPGLAAELIATNIPSAASMCYDAGEAARDPDEREQRARLRADPVGPGAPVAACAEGTDSRVTYEAAMSLALSSPAFEHQGEIPEVHTCDGANAPPPLAWRGAPEGTRSLALIVDDPDAPDPAAPTHTYVHWVLYDIPPTTTGLAADGAAPAGARAGLNDWKQASYGGPCPPIGRHRYFFKLYALDTTLGDLSTPKKGALERAMRGHVLAQAELVGTYEREGKRRSTR